MASSGSVDKRFRRLILRTKLLNSNFLWLLVLTGLTLADLWLFHKIFPGKKLLEYWAFVQAVAAVLGLSLDIDQRPSLIDAKPRYYYGAWFDLFGSVLFSLSADLKSPQKIKVNADARVSGASGNHSLAALSAPVLDDLKRMRGVDIRFMRASRNVDTFLALPFLLVVFLLAISWWLLIAPANYFVLLLCGAPARLSLTGHYRAWGRLSLGRQGYGISPVAEPVPQGAHIIKGFRDKPVTFALAAAAGTLYLIDAVLKLK